MAFVGHL